MFEEANVKPEKDSKMIAVVSCLSNYFPLPIPGAIPLLIYVLTKDKYVRFFALQALFVCFSFFTLACVGLLSFYFLVASGNIKPRSEGLCGTRYIEECSEIEECRSSFILYFVGRIGFVFGPIIFSILAAIGKPIKFPIIGNFAERWC